MRPWWLPAMQETLVQSLGQKIPWGSNTTVWKQQFFGVLPHLLSSSGEGKGCPLQGSWASLVAQLVKNLLAKWETWVQPLGWEDPLKKERLPLQCSGLENPTDCIVHGVTKSQTRLSDFLPWWLRL